jgi:hypothetical protein
MGKSSSPDQSAKVTIAQGPLPRKSLLSAKPEQYPIAYSCTIHPWMNGQVRVFDHPYNALTDDDGNFTIANAPQGKFRMVVWHEKAGYLGGKAGRFGTPIEIKGDVTQLKAMEFGELAK